MKKTITATLLATTFAAGALLSTSVSAVEGLSANVAATSNYLWRGLEQTGGKSAISGGIDWAGDSGFYLGTWVSDADWAEGMTYELDIYGGYAGAIGDDVDFDIGFVHYAYPDATDDVDFTEVNASVSFGFLSLGYAVLADAEDVDFGDDSYISVDADFDLGSDIGLNIHAGTGTDDFYAGEEFVEYGASLSKEGFTFGVSNTDLDEDDVKFYVSYGIDIDL